MEEIPLSALAGTLILLLALSAFFSLSETAMMASNRFRLRHLAQNGHRGAQLALDLFAQTDKLLGVILLGNNLINSGSSVILLKLFSSHSLLSTLCVVSYFSRIKSIIYSFVLYPNTT